MKSRLPELMERAKVDQKTLAARTGLSPTTVGKVYRNHFRAIDTHTVLALMQYFSLTSLDDLFEVVREPQEEVR